MNSNNIFGNDILNGDLTTSLVPELGQEDILIDITSQESSFTDPLTQELSLIEQEIVFDEINIDRNSPNNNTSSFNNIAVANIDPFVAANPEEFQVNQIDINDTSFAPPQSDLDLLGGFGDVDGGNDVTLEIKDDDGNVAETFKLTGEGQASLYRDEEYQYVFFSGVDETTKVDISSVSNIKFGNYIGDSLKIETSGSIEGGDILLNEPDETGLVLKSGSRSAVAVNSNTSLSDGYEIVDLGNVELTDLNNLGQAVGHGRFNGGREKGFFYDGTELNVIDRYDSSRLYAVNDSGDLVGEQRGFKPFYTSGGQYIEPQIDFTNILTFELLRDINNAGIPVGYVYTDGKPNLAVFHQNGRGIMPGDENRAFGINDLNQIIGYNSNTNQSYLYYGGGITQLENLPGNDYSFAHDINNLGQIVGITGGGVEGGNTTEAFIYQNGVMQSIGVETGAGSTQIASQFFAYGIGINDQSQVVVTSSELEPFLYQNSELTNLNDLITPEFSEAGWVLNSVKEINNQGQIIGQATFMGGNHGVILNPFIAPSNDDYINIGKITTFGDTVLLQGNEITLTGNAITTKGGEITFDGATTVNSNLIIDSSVTEDEVITDGGDITFTNTLDSSSAGSGNLRLQAGTGNILFSETVGGEATFRNINVQGADIVTATADITSDQLVRINATGDIVTQNITSDNGRVVVFSQEKSISTLDITSGSEEGDHIVLQAGDGVKTKDLLANELGTVRIASGGYLEQDSNIVGDITIENITGKRIRVESTGNFTATGDALAHDGNVVIDAKQDITTENITADNGNVRLISEEKSVTAKDITSGSETESGNIILESKEGVTTANLNARELGVVRITSGEIVENDTETLEDDTILVGDISTESITGKAVRAVGTGSFTATGDITAHDGRITVAVTNDVNTKNINSLAKSINLISTDGAVTVDGDLNSEKGGVAIHAANDIETQKIRSFDGAVALSSYDGEITVEDDINTVRGGVTIAAKEGVEVARITTGVGEVNIGSGKDIVANGNISTNVGYVNLKAGGILNVQSVTTNDGYISLGADSNVEVSSLATGSGVINLISATGSVAAGSIDTQGSYVAIESALDIIASAIEANGGGVDLVANSDFGGIGLIASGGVSDVSTDAIDSLNELISSQQEFISEVVSDLIYHRRDIGEFVIGVLYQTTVNNLEDAFNIGQFILPYKLTERDKRYWTRIIESKSEAFQLGRELANAASIIQGIIEIFTGGAAVVSGSSLCVAGAGATLGASCFAAAPVIASGAALSAHGLSLIKNGIENDTDANLIDDLLAPQNMASTGGSNSAKGLAQKIGASPDRVENALEVLGSKKIEQLEGRLNFTETRFRRNESGQLESFKQNEKFLNRMLGKSKELVYNISKAFDLVDDKAKGINDVDGINDIRATIKQNRLREGKPQLINDTELNTALIENNNFIKQYQGKASGAFANRFGKANSSELNSIEARGELDTAKDILDGNTVLGNDVKVRGLPDNISTQKNPEYLAILPDTNTRLIEVKTLTGKVERNLSGRLGNAISQIAGNVSITNPTKDGYIRLDYRNANSTNRQPNWWFDKIKNTLEDTKEGSITPGIDVIEFVEVLYKNPADEVTNILIKVENGVVKLLP